MINNRFLKSKEHKFQSFPKDVSLNYNDDLKMKNLLKIKMKYN